MTRALVMLGVLTACSAAPSQSEPVLATQQALSACVTLVAASDAMLSNPPQDHNFGGLPILRAGGKDEALLRFELDSIPQAAVVTLGTLEVQVVGSGDDTPVRI